MVGGAVPSIPSFPRVRGEATMHRVQVWAELSDDAYHAYEGEARRRAVPIEELVQQTVNCLLEELEHEEHAGTSFIVPS